MRWKSTTVPIIQAPARPGNDELVVRRDRANVRQRAVAFREIQPVAHNPFITNTKTDIVDIDIDFRSIGLMQERARP